MGEDPSEIREEIERTRDRMSETTDALVSKADIGSRARARVAEAREKLIGSVRRRLPANRDEALQQAKAAVEHGRGRAVRTKAAAQADPRGTALAAGSCVAVAAGFVALAVYERKRGSSRATVQRPTTATDTVAAMRGRLARRPSPLSTPPPGKQFTAAKLRLHRGNA
jgi:Protein of unknown function (DUF3618)